ncbi:MAG: S41 family peptidase [Bacteroidota bacterium]
MKIFFLTVAALLLTVVAEAQMDEIRIHRRTRYFKEIIKLIDKYFYFKDSINLGKCKKKYEKSFLEAPTEKEAFVVLSELMVSLKGNHSGIIPYSPKKQLEFSDAVCYPDGKTINNNVGYLKIPFFIASQESSIRYVDTLLSKISELDAFDLIGWVIDLRDNNGGIFAPMITGLAPFFSNGEVCYSIDRDGAAEADRISNGTYELVRKNKLAFSFNPRHKITMRNVSKPVAILINNKTASAAERLVICFKSLPEIKLFGQPTAGLTTSTHSETLSDGSLIYILHSVSADVKNVQYAGAITPDQYIPEAYYYNTENDGIINAAIEWIVSTIK